MGLEIQEAGMALREKGVSYNPNSAFGFFSFHLMLASISLKVPHFSVKALFTRGGNIWGLVNTKLL